MEWHEVEFTEFQFKEMNGILDFFFSTLIRLSVRLLKPLKNLVTPIEAI